MIGSSLSWRMEDADGPRELVPDQMVPVQFAELLQRASERTPELRLMAAVLEDAIRTFCRCAGSRGVRSRRLFRETAEWFDSSDASWPRRTGPSRSRPFVGSPEAGIPSPDGRRASAT